MVREEIPVDSLYDLVFKTKSIQIGDLIVKRKERLRSKREEESHTASDEASVPSSGLSS